MPRVWMLLVAACLTFATSASSQLAPDAADAGRTVFFAQGCYGCHRLGVAGTPIAHDLSWIGRKYTETQLGKWLRDPVSQKPTAHAQRRAVGRRDGARTWRMPRRCGSRKEAFGMLVHDIMQSPVITVTPGTAAGDALRLLRTRGIRHLVVVAGDGVVGIVSDRDTKQIATQPERFTEWVVDDVMSGPAITVDPTTPVEEAARLMLSQRISALPVTQAGRLVGIVTETDVVRLFVRALGAVVPSSRLDVVIGPMPTALADIVATVQASGASVSSIVTLPNPEGVREAVIRVATIDPRRAIAALTAKGYRVKTVYRGTESFDYVA